jgi:hypothetical protein
VPFFLDQVSSLSQRCFYHSPGGAVTGFHSDTLALVELVGVPTNAMEYAMGEAPMPPFSAMKSSQETKNRERSYETISHCHAEPTAPLVCKLSASWPKIAPIANYLHFCYKFIICSSNRRKQA